MKKEEKKNTRKIRRIVRSARLDAMRRDTMAGDFSQKCPKAVWQKFSPRARARAFQIFPLKSVPEFTRRATTRNWLGSRRSFADVTTRKKKEERTNGRREARRGRAEQERQRKRRRREEEEEEGKRGEGGYIGRNIYEESSSMHPHPKVAPGRVPRVCACVPACHACMCVCVCAHMCTRV